MQSPRK